MSKSRQNKKISPFFRKFANLIFRYSRAVKQFMLERRIKRHGRTQFELKLHYPLDKSQKEAEYNIDLYFFLPRSLGITKTTYRKVNFYDSIQNYIRLRTPVYTLEAIVEGENSPLEKLAKTYEKFARIGDGDARAKDEFEIQTKLFCSIFASSIRDNTYYLTHDAPEADLPKLVEKQIRAVKSITEKYRELRSVIAVPTIRKSTFAVYQFGDEYMSLLIEKYSFRILEHLRKNRFEFEKENLRKTLLELIASELDYRKKNGYALPDEESESEEMMFRFSVLKKYFNSVLSIETNKEQEGVFLEQFLFAIAAGLAMIFATAVAFVSQSIYGNMTMPFFIALVVSYMFKDRIKELTRVALKNIFSKKIYDYKTKLYLDEKYKLGAIRTSFSFVDEKKLPGEIIKLRKKYRTQEFDNKFSREKIILFRKNIRLLSQVRKSLFGGYEFDSVTDILRFDVSRFLSKMDEPRKPIFVLTKNGYKKIYARRVYHVNLIIKYERSDKTDYHRYRLVLTRKGIERIEHVVSEEY